jgi:hypothetical protein
MYTKIITWLMVGFPIDRSSWTRKRRYWLSETQALVWPKRTSSRILAQLPSQEHLVSLHPVSELLSVKTQLYCESFQSQCGSKALNWTYKLLLQPSIVCDQLQRSISSQALMPSEFDLGFALGCFYIQAKLVVYKVDHVQTRLVVCCCMHMLQSVY